MTGIDHQRRSNVSKTSQSPTSNSTRLTCLGMSTSMASQLTKLTLCFSKKRKKSLHILTLKCVVHGRRRCQLHRSTGEADLILYYPPEEENRYITTGLCETDDLINPCISQAKARVGGQYRCLWDIWHIRITANRLLPGHDRPYAVFPQALQSLNESYSR